MGKYMKFSDVKIGGKFTSDKYPGIAFTRVKGSKGTCCTPPHNAKYMHNKQWQYIKFKGKDQVLLIS